MPKKTKKKMAKKKMIQKGTTSIYSMSPARRRQLSKVEGSKKGYNY